jgi:spermidine/putrescine transport system substrate-binding protein
MLTKLALAFACLAAILGIAACGGDDVGGGSDGEVQVAQGGEATGELRISNWEGYIDPDPDGTKTEFEDETGVTVDYTADVNDNVTFFGKLRPLLEQGQSGGRDIIVVTDWMAKQMYDLGYLQEINHDDLPTVSENLSPQFAAQDADPERKFTVPWQGGMTGIWVDTAEAPDITSVNDLFDPKYKGRVTMLTEMRDTVPLVLRGEGIEPDEATKEDWLAAIDKLDEAANSGQIRRFTGNEYTQDLTSGNVVASIGWSGDESLIDRGGVEWRMPDEGCNLWFDNMVIPVGAPNTAAALEWMNFVYEPKVQADIAEWINYVTPVDGVREILTKRDPELGKNQLIFPDEQFLETCTSETEPPGNAKDVQEVNEAFQNVITG